MYTPKVVIHEVRCNCVRVLLNLLREGIGQSREAPHRLRTLRFCRSTHDVLMSFGSGLPVIGVLRAPVQTSGL
jgi:hypothetical protein